MKTLINVSAPILRDEIKELLLNDDHVTYHFIKMNGPIEMQFTAESDMDEEETAQYTRIRIHSMKYGNILVYRVLIDGQFFEHGKIYHPGDPEYAATRAAK